MPNASTGVIALIILILTAFGGAHVGSKLEREDWQAERIRLLGDMAEAVSTQAFDYEKKIEVQQASARKASENYEKLLTEQSQQHRDFVASVDRAGGLRIRATACTTKNAAPAESPGASGPDEAAAATIRIPADVEGGLFALAGTCGKVSLQLSSLQDWVIANGHYGKAATE